MIDLPGRKERHEEKLIDEKTHPRHRRRNERREHDQTFRESLAAPMSPRIMRTQHDVAFPVARILNVLFAAIVAILALRFLFLLVGATSGSDIASFIYALSEPLVEPFYGVFGTTDLASGNAIFDGSALIAMIVYALIGWALVRMIDAGSKPVDRQK